MAHVVLRCSSVEQATAKRESAMGTGTGTGPGNRGQDKTYTVTNPATGEQRTVTQREWREQKLGQQGFEKPADMPDDTAPVEQPPTDGGTTTP